MLGQTSIAAATAVVGYDLLGSESWHQSDRPRRIVSIGLKGSAAALDTKCDLQIGNTKVGAIYNSGTGAPNRDDMFRIGELVPPGQEVHLYVTDAPVTNPINVAIDFQDL